INRVRSCTKTMTRMLCFLANKSSDRGFRRASQRMFMKYTYFLLALLITYSNPVQSKEHEGEIPKLHVKGEARLFKPAEQMLIHLGVVTQDVKHDQALDDNNVKMQKVIEVLQSLGLGPENYKTGQLVVRPRYAEQSI